MTFSIIARCPHTGRLGLGIATFSIGAGGRCEGILAGVGICKTQAYTNRGNDPLAIELLAQGNCPAHVMQMLETMDHREATVLRMRFGLHDNEPRTLKEIGDKYNLSRERIRQLQEQALGKIRKHMRD